jgi:hypothetical protein
VLEAEVKGRDGRRWFPHGDIAVRHHYDDEFVAFICDDMNTAVRGAGSSGPCE